MTKTEQARFAANFLKRRTSRIVGLQNGFNDVMQFADGYTHDTLADVNTDNGAPTTTTRVDVSDVGDSDFDGSVPGGTNDDSEIYGALDILQKHVASLGSTDLLDLWASTADALKKTVSPDFVKAKPNAEGVTREPLVVNSNSDSQTAGSKGYIDVEDLENSARKLTNLSARIVNVDRL